MDALVLTAEPLPLPGRVTTGAGLRAWGLMRGLRSVGLDAWVATRRVAMEGLDEAAAQAHHTLLWEPDSIADQVSRWDPGCVIAQHWGVLRDVPPLAPPLAIDLAGPHLLERRLWGAEDWAEQLEEKLTALRRADFAVCSGHRQRLYFLNHLAMAGFEISDDTLPVVPFSADPEMPEGAHQPDAFVFGGMFLPWQDPRLAIETLLETTERAGRGHLHFWGGPHPRLDVSRGRFESLVERLERSPCATRHPLAPFDAYVRAIAACGVALDLMARNPERELAFATRTVIYLWAGLPVIHGDHDELAPMIATAQAGWVLDPSNAGELSDLVHQILDQPDTVAERRANAQRLIRSRLTWDQTIAPLAAWCREPRRRQNRLAIALRFEEKDHAIARLRRERDALESELLQMRGKLSWRLAHGLLALRWLWAALAWIALVPVALALALLFTVVDWLPRPAHARPFPSPPDKAKQSGG